MHSKYSKVHSDHVCTVYHYWWWDPPCTVSGSGKMGSHNLSYDSIIKETIQRLNVKHINSKFVRYKGSLYIRTTTVTFYLPRLSKPSTTITRYYGILFLLTSSRQWSHIIASRWSKTKWNQLQLSANKCKCYQVQSRAFELKQVQANWIKCNHVQPSATKFKQVQPSATKYNKVPQRAIKVHQLSPGEPKCTQV